MTAKLMLDRAGRIVLPKPIRDELNLCAGDVLELETSGTKITLQPVRPASALQKERGVWVYRTGEKLPVSVVEETRRQVRAERYQANLGKE